MPTIKEMIKQATFEGYTDENEYERKQYERRL